MGKRDLLNDENRLQRIENLMKNYNPSENNIKKIIALNDGLYERFKMCFKDMLETKMLIDEDIQTGRIKVSGYEIFPQYFFGYDKSEEYETLSDDTEIFFPSIRLNEESREVDFEKDFLMDNPSLNWNIENLNLPGLENHHIYMFMHHIFQDADTFCPADIPYLEPKDLQWQIVVEYEHFDK